MFLEGDPRNEAIARLEQQLAEMTASYEKQRKHNGALEMAVQEAHRDVDEANRLKRQEVEELKRLLDQARHLLTENKLWKEGPWYDRVKTVIERSDEPRTKHDWEYQSCGAGKGGNYICKKCDVCYCSPPWSRERLPVFCEKTA